MLERYGRAGPTVGTAFGDAPPELGMPSDDGYR